MKGFNISDLCLDLDSSTSSSCSVSPASSFHTRSESVGQQQSGRNSPVSSSTESPTKRPKYSYNALIAMAIQSSPFKSLRVSEIYKYISSNFSYYKNQKPLQWQNSVRHNLSLHKEFRKVRTLDGKGSYWAMTADLGTDVYISNNCGKLRRQKSKVAKFPPMQQHFPIPQLPTQNIHQLCMQNPQILATLLQNMYLQNMQNLQNIPMVPGFPIIPVPINPTSFHFPKSS
ncbi:Forkhead box protein pes-1 [Caenorhabditis elegans]|nr:Forkhead box protein pes-1 [Caenorhabditis elegans]CAA82225.1 PES-1B protein [Caenorhabditis elegans]CCQ25698.1 Forkhead box protein pes-1 [Caenorhabditis elegans]|eukprot:NP_001263750.1 Patterned Expression Site [Caenorhabditis elegans]